MKFRLFSLLGVLWLMVMTLSLCSCDDASVSNIKNTAQQVFAPKGHTTVTLIYAVASNNLEYDFLDDREEMLEAARKFDVNKNLVFLYSVKNQGDATLERITLDTNGQPVFTVLNSYERDRYSTDPQCISKVIEDVTLRTSAERYNLIFWSHATGWTPTFSDHTVIKRAFGSDGLNGKTDHCDIDELADAIPDGRFNVIWFDCCYMSSIENIYQLRNKADIIVGYPTEICAEGMNYDSTLPYIVADNPNIVAAADVLASYYSDQNLPFTIGVVNTEMLEQLAASLRPLARNYLLTGIYVNKSLLHNYARTPYGPFYDLQQLASVMYADMLSDNEDYDLNEFQSVLGKAVLYKACSRRDFRNELIPKAEFCGVTAHLPLHTESKARDYFLKLDWGRDVFATEQ